MSVEQNKDLIRRLMAAYQSPEPSRLDSLLVEDYVHHDPSLPPDMQRGRENYKQVLASFHSAFPGFSMEIDDMIAENDKVAVRWTFRGTHRGELMGVPASGKQAEITGSETYRCANGRVVEGWANFDALGLLQQIGAIPAH
jgi:steroid delta-isomerase-like uncharacterized protein